MSEEIRVGLALSGGGARAMAFHLGCLRALEDLGILKQVEVVSGVSGGSVAGALLVRSSSFSEFDMEMWNTIEAWLHLASYTEAVHDIGGREGIYLLDNYCSFERILRITINCIVGNLIVLEARIQGKIEIREIVFAG